MNLHKGNGYPKILYVDRLGKTNYYVLRMLAKTNDIAYFRFRRMIMEDNKKLKAKDFITVGIFAAILFAVEFAFGML